ncbi:hypothetical protein JF549_27570 [Labrenzia aggregata]|nr:hypothetical protein [Roseibium aggregatum]MBN8184715.1 hypothetical protein [Roseibium aggregatum]
MDRGIALSFETIGRWEKRFDPGYARFLRHKERSSGDVWHLDEIVQTCGNTKDARRLQTRLHRMHVIDNEKLRPKQWHKINSLDSSFPCIRAGAKVTSPYQPMPM